MARRDNVGVFVRPDIGGEEYSMLYVEHWEEEEK